MDIIVLQIQLKLTSLPTEILSHPNNFAAQANQSLPSDGLTPVAVKQCCVFTCF